MESPTRSSSNFPCCTVPSASRRPPPSLRRRGITGTGMAPIPIIAAAIAARRLPARWRRPARTCPRAAAAARTARPSRRNSSPPPAPAALARFSAARVPSPPRLLRLLRLLRRLGRLGQSDRVGEDARHLRPSLDVSLLQAVRDALLATDAQRASLGNLHASRRERRRDTVGDDEFTVAAATRRDARRAVRARRRRFLGRRHARRTRLSLRSRWPRATQYAIPLCDLAHASHRCAPASAASAASASADLRFLLALNPAAAAAAAVADGAPSLLLRLVPEPAAPGLAAIRAPGLLRLRRIVVRGGADRRRGAPAAPTRSTVANRRRDGHRRTPRRACTCPGRSGTRVRGRTDRRRPTARERVRPRRRPFEARGAPPCVPFSPRARRTPAGT